MPQTLKTAYLASRDVNIIIVDWSIISINDYTIARYSVDGIGELIGNFIKFMLNILDFNLDKTCIVGFSLGAHVGGIVGRMLNGSVDHLVGES